MTENTASTGAEFVLSLQRTEIEDNAEVAVLAAPSCSSCGAFSC